MTTSKKLFIDFKFTLYIKYAILCQIKTKKKLCEI